MVTVEVEGGMKKRSEGGNDGVKKEGKERELKKGETLV